VKKGRDQLEEEEKKKEEESFKEIKEKTVLI